MAGTRIQMIGLVGAGAISSATICSILLLSSISEVWTDEDLSIPTDSGAAAIPPEASPSGESLVSAVPEPVSPDPVPRNRPTHVATVMPLPAGDGGAGGFLVELLSDEDPAVRSAAVWWLTSSEDSSGLQKEIVASLRAERDPVIRMNLYRALQGQSGLDSATVLQITLEETDLAARVTGYDLLASLLNEEENDVKTREKFNSVVVPELTHAAVVGENGLHVRLTAVMALQRARTEEARLALDAVADNAADARVSEAARSAAARVGRNAVLAAGTEGR